MKTEDVKQKQAFFFPDAGRTIYAFSREEAEAELKDVHSSDFKPLDVGV